MEEMNFQPNPDPFDKTRQIPAFHAMEVSNVIQEYLDDLLQNKIEPTQFALNKNFQGPFWIIHSLSWLVKQSWWKSFFEKKLYEVFQDRNHDFMGLMAVYESIFFDSYITTSDGREKIIDAFLKYQDLASKRIYQDWSEASIFSAFELIRYKSSVVMEMKDLRNGNVYEVINTTTQNFSIGQIIIIRLVPRLDKYIFTGGFSLVREVINIKRNKTPGLKNVVQNIDLAEIVKKHELNQFEITKLFFNSQADKNYKIDFAFAMKRVSYNLRKNNSDFRLMDLLGDKKIAKKLDTELSNIFENKKDNIIQTLQENSVRELNKTDKTYELDPITLEYKKLDRIQKPKKYSVSLLAENIESLKESSKSKNYQSIAKYLSDSSEILDSNKGVVIIDWIKIFADYLYHFGEFENLIKFFSRYKLAENIPVLKLIETLNALTNEEKSNGIIKGLINKFEVLNLTDFEMNEMVLHYTLSLHQLLLDIGSNKLSFTQLGKLKKIKKNSEYLSKSEYSDLSIEFLYTYLSEIDLVSISKDRIELTELGSHFIYQRPEFDLLSWILGNLNIFTKFSQTEKSCLAILISHINKFGSAKWNLDTITGLFTSLNIEMNEKVISKMLFIFETLKIVGRDNDNQYFTTDLGVKYSEFIVSKTKNFLPFNLLKVIEI